MRSVRFQLRLTHKIAAIGLVGVVGLAAVGLIYQQGTWAQDGVRKVAEDARAILGLTKRISIEMLEARRDEKNFLLRKQNPTSSTTRIVRRHRPRFRRTEGDGQNRQLQRARRSDQRHPRRLRELRQ
jgi:methyl-accepting chemotaxis protein